MSDSAIRTPRRPIAIRRSFFTHQVIPARKRAGRDAVQGDPDQEGDDDGGQLVGPAERKAEGARDHGLRKTTANATDRAIPGPRRRADSVARSAGLRVVAAGWDMEAFYLLPSAGRFGSGGWPGRARATDGRCPRPDRPSPRPGRAKEGERRITRCDTASSSRTRGDPDSAADGRLPCAPPSRSGRRPLRDRHVTAQHARHVEVDVLRHGTDGLRVARDLDHRDDRVADDVALTVGKVWTT